MGVRMKHQLKEMREILGAEVDEVKAEDIKPAKWVRAMLARGPWKPPEEPAQEIEQEPDDPLCQVCSIGHMRRIYSEDSTRRQCDRCLAVARSV